MDDDVSYRLELREIAPSLEAWLAGWPDATPEQRAEIGLPEQGRERVVWGGIGLEPDQPGDAA